jgi:hypothetical protein
VIALKKNEYGFGIVEAFLLILIIIVVCVGGWLVDKYKTPKSTPITLQSRSSSPSSSPLSGPWRDPNMTAEIAAAGQSIVDQKQVTVSAQVDWVNTDLKVAVGQHLWVDTKAAGKWSGNPQYFPYSDANGLTTYPGGYRVDANANVLSLIGFVGSQPPEVAEQDITLGTPAGGPGGVTNPGLFEPGNTLKNFAPGVAGTVWLRNNDNTNIDSDVGLQVAKVLITSN